MLTFCFTFQQPKPFDYEHSELLLYQNMVMREAGMHVNALQHLQEYEHQIVDRLCVCETKGRVVVLGCSMLVSYL